MARVLISCAKRSLGLLGVWSNSGSAVTQGFYMRWTLLALLMATSRQKANRSKRTRHSRRRWCLSRRRVAS
jgi:hypothetical protein